MAYTKTIAILLCILIGVSSCSYVRRAERAKLAERAKTELVGLTKVDLLTCAGVPVRFALEGDMEFMSYNSTTSRRRGGSCVVTFGLKDGVVTSVNYSGKTGRRSQSGERCAYAVQNCLTSQE